MFTKEERLFIWKKVYENIERLEDGNYICVMLRNIVLPFLLNRLVRNKGLIDSIE